MTLQWTAGQPGSTTPGEDYQADVADQVTLPAGTTERACRCQRWTTGGWNRRRRSR